MALKSISECHTRIQCSFDEALRKSDVLQSIDRSHGATAGLLRQEHTRCYQHVLDIFSLVQFACNQGEFGMSISDTPDNRGNVPKKTGPTR